MINLSLYFEVNRVFPVSQEKVFKGLLDLDAAPHWMQGCVSIERMDEGSMRVGSQWKETRKMFGKQASEFFEVVGIEEPRKIMLRCDGSKGTTGVGEFLFTYVLTTSNDYTEVTLYGEIKGLKGLSKLFGKIIVGSFKKACAKDLDALKKYLGYPD